LPKRFHLAWFTYFTAGNWSETFSHGGSPWDGKFFVEFAQAMERACFDYMILEDTLMVSEAWGGTAEMSLSQALQVPKHDPVPPLAAMIAAATSRLGIVATMSTWLGRPSCWRGCRQQSTTSRAAGLAGTSSPVARMPPHRISASTNCRRVSGVTRWPTSTWI
jgi:Luciferase-like monooxygenase